jgi:hypothetical protein
VLKHFHALPPYFTKRPDTGRVSAHRYEWSSAAGKGENEEEFFEPIFTPELAGAKACVRPTISS